jgi:hypothetical protein
MTMRRRNYSTGRARTSILRSPDAIGTEDGPLRAVHFSAAAGPELSGPALPELSRGAVPRSPES